MIRVTLDIFSGRPNPTWVLDEAQARDLIRELSSHQGALSAADADRGVLGFRGLVLEHVGGQSESERRGLPERFRVAAGFSAYEEKGKELAERIVATMGQPVGIGADVVDSYAGLDLPKLVRDELDLAPSSAAQPAAAGSGGASLLAWNPAPVIGTDASSYTTQTVGSCGIEVAAFNPGFWNNSTPVRRNNNCYNYATNRRTDTFAQPGRAAGAQATVMACSNVSAGAQADGALASPTCAPSSEAPRWYMALVIWPGVDYHWYRKQAEGYWGHKPGQTAAKNTDNSNNVIYDPQTADRGGYTNFCGYFFSQASQGIR